MLVAGLTGNYGMGKSTVLDMFRRLGAITVNADDIVDRLLKDRSILQNIRKTFGDGVFMEDGRLDRAHIATLVFRDKKLRDALEALIHPLVFEEIGQSLDAIEKKGSGGKVVVVEIPLMFEAGRLKRFDRTITVYADKDTVIRRLKERGISSDDAELRLKAQMSIEEKIRRADFTIDNSGTLNETEAKVRELYDILLAEAGRRVVA